jgi:beta-lactamase class D
MAKTLIAGLLLLSTWHAHAAGWQENHAVGELFRAADVTGTFVLYDVANRELIGYNQSRAETRFVPASTFKIPNSLIGLATGAVQSVDEVLPYGGKPQRFKFWEKDMSLREAIKISNVPIYQELARRIGLERMRDNVAKLDYGNMEIGGTVDNFWLVGPLKISAVEQTRFLARLTQDDLPYPAEFQNTVREIVRLDQGKDWTLFGKTGWGGASLPEIGWWVGWVQKENRIYTFALNVDVYRDADADKRIPLGKACLQAVGILPQPQPAE